MPIRSWTKALFSLFYPKLCVVCETALREQENYLCLSCLLSLPKTDSHLQEENTARDRLRGKVNMERVASYLYYNKGGVGQKIIGEVKYKGNYRLGEYLGRMMAKKLILSGFFDEIDSLIPVPLHRTKLRKRGFNQAEAIARGISFETGIPIDASSLVKRRTNDSQTRKGVYARWLNIKDLYTLRNEEKFEGKHILLIDDVLTTGATIQACAACFVNIPDVKISILTASIA